MVETNVKIVQVFISVLPQIDEIIETATEITVRQLWDCHSDDHEGTLTVQNAVGATMRIKDCQEKKVARAELCSGKLLMFLSALEKILEQNGSTGEGFCCRSCRLRVVIITQGFMLEPKWPLPTWQSGDCSDGSLEELWTAFLGRSFSLTDRSMHTSRKWRRGLS